MYCFAPLWVMFLLICDSWHYLLTNLFLIVRWNNVPRAKVTLISAHLFVLVFEKDYIETKNMKRPIPY